MTVVEDEDCISEMSDDVTAEGLSSDEDEKIDYSDVDAKISNSFSKVRENVKEIHKSEVVSNQLKKCFKALILKFLQPVLDVKTR